MADGDMGPGGLAPGDMGPGGVAITSPDKPDNAKSSGKIVVLFAKYIFTIFV